MYIVPCVVVLGLVLQLCACGREASGFESEQTSLTAAKLRMEHNGFSGSVTDSDNKELDKQLRGKQESDKQKKFNHVPITLLTTSPIILPIPHETPFPTGLSTSLPTSDAPMPAKSSTLTFRPTLARTPAPANTPTRVSQDNPQTMVKV